ncbi:MAG: hypothetical protein CMB99_03980 [Flavobacteriaceae bacterium]|nr:hypothetical protein [Flavobacteriaceae bacterium]
MVNDLPLSLRESSGVEYIKASNSIWTHNDSGNDSEIYRLSESGEVLKVVQINAPNSDWEDITSDEFGNLYIGDFGNNNNTRKNLRIYKVAKGDLEKESAEVSVIKFRFEDQKDFPPKRKKRIFDAEAFFYFKEHLYIFTKSRISNKIGKTNLYKVPAKEGAHVAEKIGSFTNCKKKACWITGADISDDGSKMVLLSEKNLIVFSDFKDDQFFDGKQQEIVFEYQSQKEAVCFKNNQTLYITDERAISSGGNLYELKLPKN